MRAAIYARYSTALQSDASIEGQHRLCLRLINGNGWQEAETYSDRGLSGASHLRTGYQRLLEDARVNQFDVVVAEGLDRIRNILPPSSSRCDFKASRLSPSLKGRFPNCISASRGP